MIYTDGLKDVNIQKYTQALSFYYDNFELDLSNESNVPIFLDTNVLLHYYKISNVARKKLYEFISANKKRIYIPNTVQFEFLENRENLIEQFYTDVTQKLPKDLKTDIQNRINSFKSQHKNTLHQYKGLIEKIDEIEDKLKEVFDTIDSTETDDLNASNLMFKDQYLDLILNLNLSEKLPDNDIEIIIESFNTFTKEISSDKLKNYINNGKNIIPGLGDVIDKPDYPFNDYIIFHELLVFLKSIKSNCIFLTFDTAKGDWMHKNGKPHLSYIISSYNLTGNVIFVINANRFLKDVLDINIESLLENKDLVDYVHDDVNDADEGHISLSYIDEFLNSHEKLKDIEIGLPSVKLINELVLNGYADKKSFSEAFDKSVNAGLAYKRTVANNLSRIGVLRVSLSILDENFSSAKFESHRDELNKFKVFIK